MKIALLTHTPKNNYGGILQAVALYNYLEKKGHKVVLVDKKFHSSFLKRVAIYVLEKVPFQNFKKVNGNKRKTKQLSPFISKKIPNITDQVVDKNDLARILNAEVVDAVIVGSDQVWRYSYIDDGHHTVFFLDFSLKKRIKKIAYGASFGKDTWEAPEKVERISDLLNDFDAISTREIDGVDICKDVFSVNNDVCWVLDPTLLIGKDFFNCIIHEYEAKNKYEKELEIVTYILDESSLKKAIIEKLSNGFRLGESYLPVNIGGSKRDGSFYSVEEWLLYIKQANFVVTDSYHGMVFSIIFNKNFLVIGNEGRGLSRFNSLLERLGLESRLILEETPDEVLKIMNEPINYIDVQERIERFKEFSEMFLDEALSDETC